MISETDIESSPALTDAFGFPPEGPNVADRAEFWDLMPVEVRPEALAYIDGAVAALVKLGVEEQLAAIGGAVRRGTPS
jgi:hypothetical protein